MIYGKQQRLVADYIRETSGFIWNTMCKDPSYSEFIIREKGESGEDIILKMVKGNRVRVNISQLWKCNNFLNIARKYRKLISVSDIERDVDLNPACFRSIYYNCNEINIALEFLFGCDIVKVRALLGVTYSNLNEDDGRQVIYKMYENY